MLWADRFVMEIGAGGEQRRFLVGNIKLAPIEASSLGFKKAALSNTYKYLQILNSAADFSF